MCWPSPAKAFKNAGGRNLLAFRNLREISLARQVDGKVHYMQKQSISHKLHFRQPVSNAELPLFESLTNFYSQLDEGLKTLEYLSFTPQDVIEFENYLFYDFRGTELLNYHLTVDRIYRLVVNERVKIFICYMLYQYQQFFR